MSEGNVSNLMETGLVTWAEGTVLGSLLMEPESIDEVPDLRAEQFSHETGRILFEWLAERVRQGESADFERLRGDLGQSFLETALQLTDFPTGRELLVHHAETITSDHQSRRLRELGADLGRSDDPKATADRVVQRIMELTQGRERFEVDAAEAAVGVYEELDAAARAAEEGAPVGIPTGITRFDRRFGGLHGGGLYVIAGRPSMGKTALAMSWMRTMAARQYPVGFASLEMPRGQLVRRWFAQLSGVPVERYFSANLDEHQWGEAYEAMTTLSELPITINDSPHQTPIGLTRWGRSAVYRKGIEALFVDYLNILSPDRREENHQQTMAHVVSALKGMTRHLGIPVVLLAQLNRNVENRGNPTPTLADLRDTGVIEQDADMILFPFRPWVYDDTEDPKKAILYVEKNRNGPTGEVPMRWNPALTLYENPEEVPA